MIITIIIIIIIIISSIIIINNTSAGVTTLATCAQTSWVQYSSPRLHNHQQRCTSVPPSGTYYTARVISQPTLNGPASIPGAMVQSRAFSVADPRLWNGLPCAIRSASSVEQFKSMIKTHLFKIT